MKRDISFDEALSKIPNKYVLTTVAGKRARDLGNGEELLVKGYKKDTLVKKALREIYYDKVTYVDSEELEATTNEGNE